MASALKTFSSFIFILQFCWSNCLLEQGIFHLTFTEKSNIAAITKSMYNNTAIAVHIDCKSDAVVTFKWYLWWSPCANEFQSLGINENSPLLRENFARNPDNETRLNANLRFQKSAKALTDNCNKVNNFPDESAFGQVTSEPAAKGTTPKSTTTTTKARQKRAPTEPKPVATTTGKSLNPEDVDHQVVTTTKQDGTHLFILVINQDNKDDKFSADVTIYMKGPHGYLSAIEWPLLPFYGTMCLVYIVYGIVWLVLLGCNWRDLLRVQFWIGGVILIGMLEKAVFFAEFESVNYSGKSVRGALVFAEIVSSLKRATARVLVIVVSLGFGIVKPRLGPMLHKVVGVGTLYFILATIESCVRVLSDNKQNNSKASLISSIPLAVLDAALCWWIFTSLVQTTRTLRLRRNVVKLSLYRHFTNTLIFAVLASIAYMIWSIKQHKFAYCLQDWREMWVDDAFWHILFCIILMVIMVLWRPTINNQRYAFSPLLDAAEEEESEDEKPMNEALDAQKRSSKTRQVMPRDKSKSTDEDLKWIEENIPASVADTALPSLLDSDEEIMTTKYEMSKME